MGGAARMDAASGKLQLDLDQLLGLVGLGAEGNTKEGAPRKLSLEVPLHLKELLARVGAGAEEVTQSLTVDAAPLDNFLNDMKVGELC